MVTVSICRTCSQTIKFVRLDTGKAIPVEPLPHPGGNVAAKKVGGTLVGYVLALDKPLQPGHDQYQPHFAICKANTVPLKQTGRPQSRFDTPPTPSDPPRPTSTQPSPRAKPTAWRPSPGSSSNHRTATTSSSQSSTARR